jgi:UDP-N-acetylmuramoyl-tripeptide--D-alanyl-D-alanine ligase
MKKFDIAYYLQNFVDIKVENEIFFGGVSIDSRKIKEGDIFIGLKGENFDGNMFADDAIKKGACVVILDNEEVYNRIDYNKILVKNSLMALKGIGKANLNSYKGKIVCITGSAGKTTTKKMAGEVLGSKKSVFVAYKNFNNEIGVSLNAANIDTQSEYAIFEIGTNNPGEIEALSGYLNPDIGIVTNVGKSHIGRFNSVDAIGTEKASVLEYVKDYAIVYENVVPFIKNYKCKVIVYGFSNKCDARIFGEKLVNNNINFSINFRDKKYQFVLNHFYNHFVQNLCAAAVLGLSEGISYESIAKTILNFSPEEHRGDVIKIGDLTVIDDTYNCSFESLLEALRSLGNIENDCGKYALIGEMAEIEGFEDEFYKQINEFAKNNNNIRFMFFGEKYVNLPAYDNTESYLTKDEVFKKLSEMNSGVLLIKASRSKRFEEFVEFIKGRSQEMGKNAV